MGAKEITSTVDKLYGLLRLEGDHLVVQWRTAREISRVGREIRTDRELAPLYEVSLPLAGLSGAHLRERWWWFLRDRLVLNASDLRAFDALVGEDGVSGLVLEHPAELVVELRREDRALARTFVSELRLAISEHLLRASEEALDAMELDAAPRSAFEDTAAPEGRIDPPLAPHHEQEDAAERSRRRVRG